MAAFFVIFQKKRVNCEKFISKSSNILATHGKQLQIQTINNGRNGRSSLVFVLF
jgi:hypothetical protein